MMTTKDPGADLRLAGWLTYASGVLGAIGLAFLFAMAAAFAMEVRSAAMVFGQANDVLVLVSYLLTAPAVLALAPLLRPRFPILYPVLAVIALSSIAGIVVLQGLLVIGVLSFEQEMTPVSIVYIGLAIWFMLGGYLGRIAGVLPDGLRWGILGASYVGYPVWAFWMSRRLLQRSRQTVPGRLLGTTEG